MILIDLFDFLFDFYFFKHHPLLFLIINGLFMNSNTIKTQSQVHDSVCNKKYEKYSGNRINKFKFDPRFAIVVVYSFKIQRCECLVRQIRISRLDDCHKFQLVLDLQQRSFSLAKNNRANKKRTAENQNIDISTSIFIRVQFFQSSFEFVTKFCIQIRANFFVDLAMILWIVAFLDRASHCRLWNNQNRPTNKSIFVFVCLKNQKSMKYNWILILI